MNAGDTKQLTMTLTVPCGVQSGTDYMFTPYTHSAYSNAAIGNTIITNVSSSPSPYHHPMIV